MSSISYNEIPVVDVAADSNAVPEGRVTTAQKAHLDSHGVANASGLRIRVRSTLQGIVQGVGFRPAVYRAAVELAVSGWVCNAPEGVVVEAEGDPSSVEQFLRHVTQELPPGARVTDVSTHEIELRGSTTFEIRSSLGGPPVSWAPPDLATCEACLEEIRDPANRRFRHPFTNCTHCGPRFSIIRALPYDRESTTMAVFEQCPDCEREYADPSDRRFHAQPNACSRCGPTLWLSDDRGRILSRRSDALSDAANRILEGEIVAVKGLGGFHLMTRAGSTAAVARLRRRKHREEKPLALMCADLAMAEKLCDIDRVAADLLTIPQAPIVLLPRRADPDPWRVSENDQIAPDAGRLGVMLAYTPLHHLLMEAIGEPVVATSGNASDEPICIGNDEAIDRLGGIADVFLLHDRDTERAVDDSVVQVVSGGAQILRRSRGFAPLPIQVPRGVSTHGPEPAVLALGAHQKNTVTLLRGSDAFLGQHIGDLNNVVAVDAFERSATDLPNLYHCAPSIYARDLHPDYASSTFADSRVGPTVVVQHHVAHVLSGIAEHGLSGPLLGVCWDGTGLGTDATIWGGETFLVRPPTTVRYALAHRMAEADLEIVKRVSTIRPFRLVGGDRAAREPRRAALGLWDALGRPEVGRPFVRRLFSESEWDVLLSVLDHETATHVTTSVGRLFDGLSALVTRHRVVSFEAQAAIALEELALSGFDAGSEMEIDSPVRLKLQPGGNDGPTELDWGPLFLLMLDQNFPAADRALAVHVALAQGVADIADATVPVPVLLTGGCFQNRLLTELAQQFLGERGREVFLHRTVPPNDGGISLGQAVAARWASSPDFRNNTDYIRIHPAG